MGYSGTSLAAPHPTIANLFPMVTDQFNSNLILFGYCNGSPDTTAGVYEHGCLLVQIDSGTGNKAVYENTGSSASPSWNLIGAIAASEIALAAGDILVGNTGGSSVAVKQRGAVAVNTNGATLVPLLDTPGFAGSITSIEVVSLNDAGGTVTLSNNGATITTVAKGSANVVTGSGTTVNNSFTATGSVNAAISGGAATVVITFVSGN